MQSTPREPAWRLTAECPRCGNDLVVRYARHDHQPFIGCVSYPTCRFTCEYDEALQCLANPHEHEAEVRRCKIENQPLAAEVNHLSNTNRLLAVQVQSFTIIRDALQEQVRRLSLATNTKTLTDPEELTRALTHLVTLAHPDRWDQGQPAAELAHVITQELLKLCTQLQRGR